MTLIITLFLWLYIGAYNLVVADEISKLSYFLCWLVWLFGILAVSSL